VTGPAPALSTTTHLVALQAAENAGKLNHLVIYFQVGRGCRMSNENKNKETAERCSCTSKAYEMNMSRPGALTLTFSCHRNTGSAASASR
jgi:hypothetical protein